MLSGSDSRLKEADAPGVPLQKRTGRNRAIRIALIVVGAALVLSFPLVSPNPYILSVGIIVLNYAVLATGWTFVGGVTGYISLGQSATELSGGEAQRVKLAAELRRAQLGDTLYLLDEPTSGLHPADSDRLIGHLQRLVDGGNTVIVVEHDMRVVAEADWVIDLGPGAGDAGGQVVAKGTPEEVSVSAASRTAPFLEAALVSRGQC